MTVVYIFIGVVTAYAFGCLFPSLFMFRAVFRRQSASAQVKRAKKRTHLLPYEQVMAQSARRVQSVPCTRVCIKASDGAALCADYHHVHADKTAILIHGYRSFPLDNCGYLGAAFLDRGYNILLVHLRGHGKSGGKYTTMGLMEREDALCWIHWAAQQQDVSSIVAYGVSLGATSLAFASDGIQDRKVRALILDCGFTSLYRQLCADCKKMHIPHWMVLPQVALLYRLKFHGQIKASTTQHLAKSRVPTFFLHGTDDHSVPFAEGQRSFDACGAAKEALFVTGADHTGSLLAGGEEALRKLFCFIEKMTG